MNQEQHEMILEVTHSSGMQGWYCPTCGRRILLLVPPNGDMVLVEPGNHDASHSGSRGGLRVAATQNHPGQDQKPADISEESLRPWIKALEKLDLNW